MTAAELRALFALLERAPMSPAEALFAEGLFNRLVAQLEQPQDEAQAESHDGFAKDE
jgi:hypothetical protein